MTNTNPAAVRTVRERESFRDAEFGRLAATHRALNDELSALVIAGQPVPADLRARLAAARAASAAHPYSVACAAWYSRNGEEE